MTQKFKKIFFGVALVAGTMVAGSAAYWHSLDLDSQPLANPDTRPSDLAFLKEAPQVQRGKILAVVTSTGSAPGTDVNMGYELTELARAYYVFKANGFEVDIASPLGGRAPVNIDEELTEADYAFLNDESVRGALADTKKLSSIVPEDYAAVYFVGGKGVMFDFPNDPDVKRITANIYERGGVVGAVCHGPVALVDVTLSDGSPILAGKTVTGFTNEEELFLIDNAREVFPFLLEDGLMKKAGKFVEGPMYLDKTITDGRIVTGQNPWSTWSVAESMIEAMGYELAQRERTMEERAADVLATYYGQGFDAAKRANAELGGSDKRFILLHALIAAMQGEFAHAYHIQRLAH